MTHLLPRPARRGRLHAPLRGALAAAACSLCLLAAQSAQGATLDDLRQQVESGQFARAYATAQQTPQLIGNVHFDFLYGIAAVNSGHVADGVLALERHLAAVPANDRARLELARGYFLLGDYTRARAEFEFVLRYNPPAGVRRNIEGFLQAMQVREPGESRAIARFYAEAGAGHDSNVNGGTFRDELQLVIGTINLSGSPSLRVPDNFGEIAVGGQKTVQVTHRLSLFAGADFDERANVHHHEYGLTSAAAYVGFSQIAANALWRLTLGSAELRVGGERYRDTLSSTLESNFTFGPDVALVGFVQYGELRYLATDEVRNGHSTTVGAMLTHNLSDAKWSPAVGFRVSYTQEQNLRLRDDLSFNMPLLRLFLALSPIDRMRVTVGVTGWTQRYGGTDLGFGTVRSDDATSLDAQVNYALDAHWSLRADGAWTVNRSNQDLYDTSRKTVSLKVRYQF
jgi:tetratricopeptide (TPR) repeat protein